ncbi:hypothetical protein VP01_873g2 [Puccinia sorghi]|uniref:Uncharacterized protein n=1 Tax=Puccinia sorghi TaxID=27349 RepID=A0A0L6U8K6_9BASI|nr:hypothetical protein VP01_873g2 [Puccinia sorghi]
MTLIMTKKPQKILKRILFAPVSCSTQNLDPEEVLPFIHVNPWEPQRNPAFRPQKIRGHPKKTLLSGPSGVFIPLQGNFRTHFLIFFFFQEKISKPLKNLSQYLVKSKKLCFYILSDLCSPCCQTVAVLIITVAEITKFNLLWDLLGVPPTGGLYSASAALYLPQLAIYHLTHNIFLTIKNFNHPQIITVPSRSRSCCRLQPTHHHCRPPPLVVHRCQPCAARPHPLFPLNHPLPTGQPLPATPTESITDCLPPCFPPLLSLNHPTLFPMTCHLNHHPLHFPTHSPICFPQPDPFHPSPTACPLLAPRHHPPTSPLPLPLPLATLLLRLWFDYDLEPGRSERNKLEIEKKQEK